MPWLGGVIVHPSMRKQGIGTFLVKQAEAGTAKLGYSTLYLYPSAHSDWPKSLGWQFVEAASLRDSPITIMKKDVSHQSSTSSGVDKQA